MMANTILLIEDSAELRENTAEILELAEYNVVKAKNGKEGLELARKSNPDLILCDVMMPELDGYGVLRAVGNIPELKGVPFVFVTAKSEKKDFRHGMNLGADDYLAKPFTGDELLNIVGARIQKARILREVFKNNISDLEGFVNEETPLKDIKPFMEKLHMKKVSKKDPLFTEGESSNYLYYIFSGKVKLFKTNDMGKEYITHIYKETNFFGYHALLEDNFHAESAEALENCEIGTISRQDFFQMLQSNPDIAVQFIKRISSNLSEAKESLVKLAYNSARKRVAEALLYIAQKYSDTLQENVSFPLTRNDISALSGISPESVSRNLTDFREEGLIDIKNSFIYLLNPKKLINLKN